MYIPDGLLCKRIKPAPRKSMGIIAGTQLTQECVYEYGTKTHREKGLPGFSTTRNQASKIAPETGSMYGNDQHDDNAYTPTTTHVAQHKKKKKQ